MVLLRIPPLPRGNHLRHDLALVPLLVRQLRDLLGRLALLVVVVEDGAAVLRAGVGALAVRGGGVVHAVEELEEGAVGDLRGVVDDLQGFRVAGVAAADGAVGRVGEVAADVADAGVDEALLGEVLAVEVLDAPEAAGGDGGLLRARREGGAGGGVGGEGHCGGCEGASEAGEEGEGHCVREEDCEEESEGEGAQSGGEGRRLELLELRGGVSGSGIQVVIFGRYGDEGCSMRGVVLWLFRGRLTRFVYCERRN